MLMLVAAALFVLATKMGSNGGELATVPAVMYLCSGLGVLMARTSGAKTLAVLCSLPLLLLLYAVQGVCLICK
jgi:hypothetical protein